MRSTSPGYTVEEARAVLLHGLAAGVPERIRLADALGRVLAGDVVAQSDLPGADNSAMDGYAVLAADIAAAGGASPVLLPPGGEARAGRPAVTHRPGTATQIATGALLPHGANAVVPVESTELRGRGVLFAGPASAGAHVRSRGEDVQAGQVLLHAGCRLRSVDIGMCAAAGVDQILVTRRPRVALLSNGDELVQPGVRPRAHQVTDVNSSMLTAAVLEAGGVPLPVGVVRDERAAVSLALHRAASADMIISSAGVSVGEHDHVRECVAELGSVDIWKVAMRPGRPLVVGRVRDTPFLGLPGNPVSSAVTFLLFARPATLAFQGAAALLPPRFPAVLAEAMTKPAPLETYIRVRLERDGGQTIARPSGGQGSAMMHALAAADALAILPAGAADFPAGSPVDVMLIP